VTPRPLCKVRDQAISELRHNFPARSDAAPAPAPAEQSDPLPSLRANGTSKTERATSRSWLARFFQNSIARWRR